MYKMTGKFITLEGAEGTGKSLHSKMLCRYLRSRGYQVLHTLEPGSTKVGKAIRNILLNPKYKGLGELSELFLYLADRNQHVNEVILPALRQGKIVVCDRYLDATVAYQGYGRKISLPLINQLNKLATKGLKPDLTVIMDVPIKLGLKRAIKIGPYKGDRMEREKYAFHQRVKSGYRKIANKEPKRVKILSTTKPIKQVQTQLRFLVNTILR